MHERRDTHLLYGFSPWESWSPDGDVCFHDRIAEGIKNKTLSTDNVADVVLQLLTRANEIALALLKEVQYADSTCVGEINTCALVMAQRHISKACDLMRGKSVSGVSLKAATRGDRLLHVHFDIIDECYAAMRLMNTFYRKLDMWIYECDEKCGHVVRMEMLLVNAIDAVQQCHFHAFSDEYVTHDDEALDKALGRAEHCIKIVANALNAVKIPVAQGTRRGGAVKPSALSSNCSLLISTFKLLSLGTRKAFPVGKARDIRVYDHMRSINYSCGFRSLILRTIADEFVIAMEKCKGSSQLLTWSTVIWALSQLSDNIDDISAGMYADVECGMHYATKISLDITECVTQLTLLVLAHETKGMQNSGTGKILEHSKEMSCGAALECGCLEGHEEHNLTDASMKRLYNVLAYAEVARENLAAINRNELPNSEWSSSLLDQAIVALDRAVEACVSKLGVAEAQTRERRQLYACGELSPFGDLRRKTAHHKGETRNRTTPQRSADSCSGNVCSVSISGGNNSIGGGYSGSEELHLGGVTSLANTLENASIEPAEQNIMAREQGISRTRL
ncbi:hypothetical protein PGW94_01050 [Candidatus Anaplasma sp. TIGMIC]|nr:hypothetical protein [Candidatus Anaplasma sp. TIGMIC]